MYIKKSAEKEAQLSDLTETSKQFFFLFEFIKPIANDVLKTIGLSYYVCSGHIVFGVT